MTDHVLQKKLQQRNWLFVRNDLINPKGGVFCVTFMTRNSLAFWVEAQTRLRNI